MANFWCVMQDLDEQPSVAVSETMCRWMRSRMFSYGVRETLDINIYTYLNSLVIILIF